MEPSRRWSGTYPDGRTECPPEPESDVVGIQVVSFVAEVDCTVVGFTTVGLIEALEFRQAFSMSLEIEELRVDRAHRRKGLGSGAVFKHSVGSTTPPFG